MSITLTHGGLPSGIGRFALLDTFDAVARITFGISGTAIRLLRHHVSKCRDSDFLAGRICGTLEQPQQTAKLLGISTRVLNNAERELIAKGFVNRSATPHARREGRRSGDKIAYAAGINLAPLVDRYPELVALQSAQELQEEAQLQLRREIADIRGQIRASENIGRIEQAEDIIPRGRTSRITDIERLKSIKMDLEALLVCLQFPTGEQKSSDRTEENFSPNILEKDSSKNCSIGRRRNENSAVTPEVAARLASEDYRTLLDANGGPTRTNLIETSSMACSWLGISQKVWGEACQQLGREQAALCVLVIDRNWRLPVEHRYRGRRPKACLQGIIGKGRNQLNLRGFLRAIQGYPESELSILEPQPLRTFPRPLDGVRQVGQAVQHFLSNVQIIESGEQL
jgi:replication initiation protein RepC